MHSNQLARKNKKKNWQKKLSQMSTRVLIIQSFLGEWLYYSLKLLSAFRFPPFPLSSFVNKKKFRKGRVPLQEFFYIWVEVLIITVVILFLSSVHITVNEHYKSPFISTKNSCQKMPHSRKWLQYKSPLRSSLSLSLFHSLCSVFHLLVISPLKKTRPPSCVFPFSSSSTTSS